MFFDVTSAKYQHDYKIKIGFEDGSAGVADLSDYKNPNTVFKSFLDLEYFKTFKIEHGTIVWGNGELDIAPETLYAKATGKKVSYLSDKDVV